jgi:hypothetical protein
MWILNSAFCLAPGNFLASLSCNLMIVPSATMISLKPYNLSDRVRLV